MTLAVVVRLTPTASRGAVDVVGHLELRHVPRAHRELPPRPAPRRVRRRARPGDARVPRAASRRSTTRTKITKPLFVVQGKNDPRVPLHRGRADRRAALKKRHAGLVPARQGRGPRLREEGERRLPVLRDDGVHRDPPARGRHRLRRWCPCTLRQERVEATRPQAVDVSSSASSRSPTPVSVTRLARPTGSGSNFSRNCFM